MYAVDGSEPEHWGERVREPALQVVEALMNGTTPVLQPLNPPGTDQDNIEITSKFVKVDFQDTNEVRYLLIRV